MANESARLALPLLQAGQAQKEITHNEALTRLDMLVQAVVESADLATPPASPAPGQCWIVAASPGGAWAGRAGTIAAWTDGGWRFVAPVEGMAVQVRDRGHDVTWDGSAWRDGAVRSDGFYQGGVRIVGGRGAAIADPIGGTVIDGEARATIGAILAMLRLHGMIA